MTTDIDAIRQREQAATCGPWKTGDRFGNRSLGSSVVVLAGNLPPVKLDPHRNGRNDAVFIAHARQDISTLLAKVDELTAELDRVRADERNTIAADIENMPINLGDTGWKHLETKADEASYPAEWVRRRRTRDDFTTATIEVAYQYGYRQAAKVARGEVAR